MKESLVFLYFACFTITLQAQTLVKGSVNDAVTFEPIIDVLVSIEKSNLLVKTDVLGQFLFTENIPLGEQTLKISKSGFIAKRFPIIINAGEILDVSDMTLETSSTPSEHAFTIILSDDELDGDQDGLGNISGLLSSSLDVFQRTAAFEFSASFFRVRGLDADNSSVLINGIEMNKLFNGRPQWSNWGGMNDVLRNQELTIGLKPSNYNFGGVLGTTNINTRASEMNSGGRITYSSSNRSYSNRLMATYGSGLLSNGWAYTLSLGRRWGNSGYQDATLYDSNSLFTSVEKKFNENHSLSFTGIYAPNRRGKSSANTQEVYDLKGIKYNEYWGYQNGKKRNSRIKEVIEPIVMLNHYWNFNKKSSLTTNMGFQFGTFGNSRLTFGGANLVTTNAQDFFESGGTNPSPSYYQKLPSYFERNFPNDLGFAYLAQQEFLNHGQLDWQQLYTANAINASQGKNATYILSQDRVDDKQLSINTGYKKEINDHVLFNAAINYKSLKSENYATVLDLLGGTGFLNVDSFDGIQFNLQNPNFIAKVGDKFSYNYNMFANVFSAYTQAQFRYNQVDFYASANITTTTYQREGLFQNEAFINNSFGKADALNFTGIGAKAGATYKITGKHVLDGNAGYLTKAPSIRNSFSNSRSNHNVVPNITEEKITSFDASYIYRSNIVKTKLTGFYTMLQNANEISFFFADGIGNIIAESGTQQSGNDETEFVQEILQGIDKNHLGVELGIEAQVTPTITLKGAVAYGQYTYANNPDLYLSSDRFENVYLGKSYLKNYQLPVGPHEAYSVGFEYRYPDYWWFGATANFFDQIYIDISPLTRTTNFYTDVNGAPFLDYDETIARDLLTQESFSNYMIINLIGGKSWLIDGKYIGLFASVNNLLDAIYRTGGFEQGRNANYRQLRDDAALQRPVFGSRYWYGRGATYFLNLNMRF